MVEGDGSYFDESFCLANPRLRHVLVTKLVWPSELVENNGLQSSSLPIGNNPACGYIALHSTNMSLFSQNSFSTSPSSAYLIPQLATPAAVGNGCYLS